MIAGADKQSAQPTPPTYDVYFKQRGNLRLEMWVDQSVPDELANDHTLYIGVEVENVKAPNGRTAQITLRFRIVAKTLNEAFDLYHQSHNEAQKATLAQMDESRPRIARVCSRLT
jgi:hypothetical protein